MPINAFKYLNGEIGSWTANNSMTKPANKVCITKHNIISYTYPFFSPLCYFSSKNLILL